MIASHVYDPAHEGNVDQVREWLTKHPGDINSVISDGMTLLHVACAFGQAKLVSFLLERTALVNIEAKNDSRATPLHLAVTFRDEDTAHLIAQSLIGHGAELNAAQNGGQTPLHHAVARPSLRLAEELVLAGADPFLKDAQGHSPMDLAKGLAEPLQSEMKEILKQAQNLI